MAISNICLAKHLGGEPVLPGDVKVGLELYFKNNTGGVTRHQCISFDGDMALFRSTNIDWPGEVQMDFNAPDFTLDEFELLSEALDAFGCWNQTPTNEQRMLVHRAKSLGYAHCSSYTQASWSEHGVDTFRELNGVSESESQPPSKIKKSPSMGLS